VSVYVLNGTSAHKRPFSDIQWLRAELGGPRYNESNEAMTVQDSSLVTATDTVP